MQHVPQHERQRPDCSISPSRRVTPSRVEASATQSSACQVADLPCAGGGPVVAELQAVGVQPEAGEEGRQVGLPRLRRQAAHQHRRSLRPAVRCRCLQEAGSMGGYRVVAVPRVEHQHRRGLRPAVRRRRLLV